MSEGRPAPPFLHRPVMEAEIVEVLGAVPPGLLVDATVGGGGHGAALLEAHPGLSLLGIDRDPAAVAAAMQRLEPWAACGRVAVRGARFDTLAEVLRTLEPPLAGLPVTAVLFDLGVSSPQMDRPERGFSYRQSGPLDMRMGPGDPSSAADIVNAYSESRLVELFRANGEARFARRIARAIVAGRPLHDTIALAEIVRDAIPAPARRHGGHPAKRVFQAIRIEVNGETAVLGPALAAALAALAPGGRLAVLSYHSGEDRIVKAALTGAALGCVCPPGLPCVCGAVPEHRLVFRGSRTPGAAEVAGNPRARSARLRAVEHLRPHDPPGGTR